MCPAAGWLRKSRLHLRGVLGRAGADPAVGGWRYELGANVVQPRYRQFLRSRDRTDQRLWPLWRYVQERVALCRRYPIGADRLTDERHFYCGRRQHQQDRVAEQDAISYRQWRRL